MMSAPSGQRRLAAIMAADVVGYSRLMGDDEETTLRALMVDREIIESVAIRHGGRLFGVAGDSLMAEFASAVEATRCAIHIQQALAAHDAKLPEERRMQFRIGVHLGDVIVHGNNLYGDGVNVAARLEALAPPGEIRVSDDVYRHARRKTDLAFEDVGEHEFKNIADPVHVYRVRIPDNGRVVCSSDTEARAAEEGFVVGVSQWPDTLDKPAIVVLPFENLSGDSEQEYFCDGLTNDITTDLSKFQMLFVIAATSAFTYKGKQVKAQDIGRELGVQYVLEGSVQRAGDSLRVNTQLIEASTDYHLWAERFHRKFTDLFEVQDEIIQLIVSALAVNVDAIERERAIRKKSTNVTAYDAFLRGFHLWGSHLSSGDSVDELLQSRRWYQLATELDPNFSRAWARLAYVNTEAWVRGWADDDALESAEKLAMRALDLNSSDYDNHWALAYVYLNTGRLDLAIREYRVALSMNSNDADLLAETAGVLSYVGEFDEGVELLRRAMRINLRFPDWYYYEFAWSHYCQEKNEAALEYLNKMTVPSADARVLAAVIYAELGQRQKAKQEMKRFLEKNPDWSIRMQMRSEPFKRSKDANRWKEGLRKAGLPEGD